MTPEEFLSAVETSADAHLEELDSAVLPADAADRDHTAETAIRTVARGKAVARDLFASWAEGAVDDILHDTYLDAAEREAEHYQRLLAELPEGDVEPEEGELDTYLREVHNPAERIAGGFVGRGLVEVRTLTRLEAFFVHYGDHHRADIFQDLRDETEPDVQRGADLLGEFCRMDDDWERALETALQVVALGVEEWVGSGSDASDVESRS